MSTEALEISVLQDRGIENAVVVASVARSVGLEFSVAAALVEKESGGRNIYGHDRGGVYSTADLGRPANGMVTEGNFAEFERRVLEGGETSNGVGLTQITWPGFLRQARSGGVRLWDPADNLAFGFTLLLGYLNGSTSDAAIEYAGKRYNGAAAYGVDLLARTKTYRKLIEETPMAVSFNGFTVLDQYPPDSGTFCAPGMKEVYCRNRATAVCLEVFARRWHAEVEPIAVSHPDNRKKDRERMGETKAGAWDAVGIHDWRPPNTNVGTGNQSNHRSGTCLDINGHKHPYEPTVLAAGGVYSDGFTQKQRDTIRQICKDMVNDAGRSIGRSGLDFAKGKRDGMHVELASFPGQPNITQTDINQAAKKWEDFVGRSSTAAVWWVNARGYDVMAVQADLLALGYIVVGAADGYAGNKTDQAVRAFQGAEGLTVDGRVGDATRARIKFRLANPVVPDPEPEPAEDLSPFTISGSDRYETSAQAAVRAYPLGAPAVYLAAGLAYSDQIAATAFTNGPVLLVREGNDRLPSDTAAAIRTLKPSVVLRIGGGVSDGALIEARRVAGLTN